MKKCYKLLVLSLFVLMLALSISACGERGTKGLAFNLIDHDTAYEVSVGTATESGYTKIVIPSKYKNKPVTRIAQNGFFDKYSDNGNVRTDNITAISIPTSVTDIGQFSFANCNGLTDITIPPSVIVIGEYAFAGCSGITNISIPSSVEAIGEGAFQSCSGIKSINIPFSVKAIGNNPFSSCGELTNITVDAENTVYKSDNNCIIKIDDDSLITGCKSSIIPSSVKSIKASAFLHCNELNSITIPSSVTYIGDYAFGFCVKLSSITIPSSVTYIGNSAFTGCSGLINIAIPSSVTLIETLTFSSCKALTSVTILSPIKSLGYGLFWDCSALTSLTIPVSVKSIVSWVFEGCSELTTVYYAGNKEQWDAIEKGTYNDALDNATIYYYSKTEKDGNYWCYVDDVPTKWSYLIEHNILD